MGLFDLPAPLLSALDGWLAPVMSSALRIGLWGVVAGAASMALYARLSPQRRLARLKAEAKAARAALDTFDGPITEAGTLVRATLTTAWRQLATALGPATLASLPLLFLLIWLSNTFGHEFPPPGRQVEIHTRPQAPAHWIQNYEGPPKILVEDSGRRPAVTVVMTAPIPTVHRRRWWNLLIGNPVGYLPTAAAVDEVNVQLPRHRVLPFGPDWLAGWEVPFFMALIVSSLIIKTVFRIE